MTTPGITVTGDQLLAIHDTTWSLDDYRELRRSINHKFAREVLEAGNISVVSYQRCRSSNISHEDILRVAARSAESLPEIFDTFVRKYIGYGVSLDDAFVAAMNGIPCTLGRFPNKRLILADALKQTTIDELASAWKQLRPGMDRHAFLRSVAAGQTPQVSLSLL